MELVSKGAFGKAIFEKVTLANGDTCYLRVISGKERDLWNTECEKMQTDPNPTPMETMYASLLVKALCDETGARIFSDEEAVMVTQMPATRLYEIFTKALSFNALDPKTKDALKKE